MAPRGAWVREKRRPKSAQVDPTVALLPMLNYLGCRPNNTAPRRAKVERQDSPDFEAIEIVAPPKQHNHHHQQRQDDDEYHASNQHQYTQQQQRPQPLRQLRTPSREMIHGPSGRAAKQRTAARPPAMHEALTRPHPAPARLSPYSTGGARPHTGGLHTGARVSPHMSRAMAVNLNAITPLAM